MKNIQFDFYFFKKINNTNDEIKKIFNSSSKKTNIALFSEIQLMGRGRTNKKWHSSFGDLTCSFLINKNYPVDKLGQINLWILSKLFDVLKKNHPLIDFKIKWPNDIYYKEKKLAGVLIETNIKKNLASNIIFGIGINCLSTPNNIDYPSISISQFSNNKDPLNLFIDLSKKIDSSLDDFKNIELMECDQNFMSNFKDIGQKIKVKVCNEIIEGKFLEINKYGHLILDTKNEILKIDYGDII